MLAVQLAQFVFHISATIRSVSSNTKLWDLTFRVDRNHVFGALQFETKDRHERIQMQGHFYTSSLISTDPTTRKTTFYHELSGLSLPDHAVSTYVRKINESLRSVQFFTL
jgi:hypothetical protein